ncbi:pyridoxamine 5'-phosphate oxidase family protein [Pseudooceanicola sp.]|uniref:pyridoxamine 5'-phosphate oxidase family protein n=1 Tax=Pseudooceanicola sp. TaxID=1914328 RepID=UPI0035C6EB90
MKDQAHNLADLFWTRSKELSTVMLDVGGRTVPMTPYIDRGEGLIWFITAEGTEAHTSARGGGRVRVIVSDISAQIFADIEGSLTVSDNPDKLDELWSPVASMWFDDGREDDDVRLLAFRPTEGEVWATDGSAGFIYQVAKSKLTGETADLGDHGRVTF